MIRGSGIGTGEYIGQDSGLLPEGRDEAVHLTAVLTAFADGIDGTLVLAT